MEFKDKLDKIFEGLSTSRFLHGKSGLPIKRSFRPDHPEVDPIEKIQTEIAKLRDQLEGTEDPDRENGINTEIQYLEHQLREL